MHMCMTFSLIRFIGFNPEYKRTVAYADRTPTLGSKGSSKPTKLRIGKGLVDKILSTSNDGGDCWEVENFANVKDQVKKIDTDMSLKGYKTIAIAVSEVIEAAANPLPSPLHTYIYLLHLYEIKSSSTMTRS